MIKERIWVRLIKTSTERVLCAISATYLIFLIDFVYQILLLRFMKFCFISERHEVFDSELQPGIRKPHRLLGG